MKKIAFIVCNIEKVGGTERAVMNVTNELCKDDDLMIYIISMFSAQTSQLKSKLNKRIVVVHLGLKDVGRIQLTNSYISFINQISKITRSYKIDILIGTTHAINCMITFCNGTSKKIGCEHTIYDACPRMSQIIRKNRYKKLDAVVLLTNSDAMHYSFVDPNRRFVIPNALSFEVDNPADLDNKVIIAAGRLTPVKRFNLLIDLCMDLKKRIPDWQVKIFGEGECKNELFKQIEKNKLNEYVKIMGNSNKMQEEIMGASIMVMTSKYEGLPMILIEAQACGLPVVAFDCPEGPRNIISDGLNGYLIPENDNTEFINSVTKLATNKTERSQFGLNAFSTSKKYQPQYIANLWTNLFSSVCKE